MAKEKTQFICQSCGRITPAYMGRCPRCGEFGTMVEEIVAPENTSSGKSRARVAVSSQPQRLAEVTPDAVSRLPIAITEFSRVLGGGIVPGSLVLVGGDPGIGKSTLLLQVAALVANQHGVTLYVSGEESSRQIKMRADRLSVAAHDLFLVTETNLAAIMRMTMFGEVHIFLI